MFGISSGNLAFPLIITFIIYCIKIYKHPKEFPKNIIFIDSIFIIYCYLLIGRIYFPIEIYHSVDNQFNVQFNTIPFSYIIELIANNFSADMLISIIHNVLGNFFAFVPLGLYLAFRKNKKAEIYSFYLQQGSELKSFN